VQRDRDELDHLVEAARSRGAQLRFQPPHAISIGLKSGLQGGRNRRRAPAPSIAA
jgi:hypothetical protein